LAFAASACRAGEVLFIHGPSATLVAQAQLELAARFYGLHLVNFQVRTRAEELLALSLLKNTDILAAVVSADSLPQFSRQAVLASLYGPKARHLPLLVLGVTSQSDTRQLASWSGNALSGCYPLPDGVSFKTYVVGGAKQITQELAGQQIPNFSDPACEFAINTERGVQPLLSLYDPSEPQPFFVWCYAGSRDIFFLAQTNDSGMTPAHIGTVEIFSRLAPIIMFFRYAAGDKAWHSDGHYANLTIDDAWLTEPYGHLNYQALLTEMKIHGFHTTIAFIPWNFDRSEQGVAQLFRSYEDKYSICIHGNNHDHLEFGSYDEKPLAAQTAGIKQALARMERFHRMTGVPFDRVMIFPHEVAPPVSTLRKLKEYDFLAAANAVTVPSDSAQPADPLFSLRAVSAEFAEFPLVRRYAAEATVSKSFLAINAFLGNPILFYGHQSLFDGGISAFDSVADAINQVEPETRWESIGSIAQHFYLIKRRDDRDYDVLALSSNFLLHNQLPHGVTFYVEKKEDEFLPIKSLTVNGKPYFYDMSSGYLRLIVPVSAGGSSHVVIEYQNDLDLGSTDIAKKSLYVTLLRRVSDFRDITLSQSSLGRVGTRLYYEHHVDGVELTIERSALMLLVLAVLAVLAGREFQQRARAKRAQAGKQGAVTVKL
jgi:hypothetical protein